MKFGSASWCQKLMFDVQPNFWFLLNNWNFHTINQYLTSAVKQIYICLASSHDWLIVFWELKLEYCILWHKSKLINSVLLTYVCWCNNYNCFIFRCCLETEICGSKHVIEKINELRLKFFEVTTCRNEIDFKLFLKYKNCI